VPQIDDRWPVEIRLGAEGRILTVLFERGERFSITAELLRVESPSAEVKGHGPGQEVLVVGKGNVRILRIEPVGTYAIRLIFDDTHATGIFTWNYLFELGRDSATLMAEYRKKINADGRS
jgi:DUF971 family protein